VKKHKKGAYRWVSFENTLTPGVVRGANHPQSFWQSKNNNSTLDRDRATAMDGSITDFFRETFGPDPIYELAAKCNIFRGCIGAQTKEEADLVREKRVTACMARTYTWEVCGHLVGEGMTEEDWNALPLKERMKLGVAQMCTWKACGELKGTDMTEEDWNALPLEERTKLGSPAKFAEYYEVLWNRRYGELCLFILANGHSQVPREKRTLQDWVSYQKKAYKNGTMSLAHKKLMDEIGDFSGDDGMKAVLGGTLEKHGQLQVIPESLDELDVTEDSFTSSDVLIVKGNGGNGHKNLPGNLRLEAAISNHMPDDLRGSTQWSDLAKLVINEIESLVPPGGFLELKPGNRCFCIVNRDRVIELIKQRFSNKKFSNKKHQEQKSRDKGCPVTTFR
jgi:hypothetical protein